ncbi:hypothetical protein ES708_10199 [subsurface metagenome]
MPVSNPSLEADQVFNSAVQVGVIILMNGAYLVPGFYPPVPREVPVN